MNPILSWFGEAMVNPSAATHMQTLVIAIIAFFGSREIKNYFKLEKAKKRHELAQQCYIHCREGAGVLLSIKRSPIITRDFINNMKKADQLGFLQLMGNMGKTHLEGLETHKPTFNKIRRLVSESKLFLGSEKSKPTSDILYCHNRLTDLFSTMQTIGRGAINEKGEARLTPYGIAQYVEALENAISQVWENVGFSEEQRNAIIKKKHAEMGDSADDIDLDAIEFVSIDKILKSALDATEKLFPPIIENNGSTK